VSENVCPNCVELGKELAKKARENTRLRNEEAERLGKASDSKQILDVLTYHKTLHGGRIYRGKAAWKAVKAMFAVVDAETDRPAFTVDHLRAASLGLKLDDYFGPKRMGAAWLYADPDRVQKFIGNCVTFKRDTGVSALEIVDELGRPGLERLAARCDCCGHLRLDHERERPELDLWDPPCAVHGCGCPGFEDFDWRVTVRLAELERERVA
jgi:hypothetical protein